MTKVSIAIAFLTVFAQLQYGQGNGNGRNGVRPQTMTRVSSFPRPPLRSPSSSSFSTKSADLLEPGVLPSRQSDTVSSMDFPRTGQTSRVFGADGDILSRRANEMHSEMKKLLLGDPTASNLPASGARRMLPPRVFSFSSSNTFPDSSSDDFFEEHKRKFDSMVNEAENMIRRGGFGGSSSSPSAMRFPANGPASEFDSVEPPARAAQPPARMGSFPSSGASGGSSGSNFEPPPSTPEPSNPPPLSPSSHWRGLARRFREKQDPFPSSTSRTTTPPPATPTPPPPSCAAGDQKPSISQYRNKSSMSKSPSIKEDDYKAPKAAEPSPPPKPETPTATPAKYGGMGGTTPRGNSASTDSRRFGGSTVISENLPSNGGKIDIKISGRDIDDERMSQMIKEAKNAITVVFYAPLFDTTERGEIIFSERPPTLGY